MSTWNILENILQTHVLSEEKMYRGESLVRMKDLEQLFRTLAEKGASSDPQVNSPPNPQGGSIVCMYPADARVWGRWSPNLNLAKVLASTDKKDTQHVGAPKGNMVFKKNYGGGIVATPGPVGKDFDQYHSAYDRYDVIMVAEVGGGAIQPGQNVNWNSSKKEGMPSIVVKKIVWSPIQGSSEERETRVMALLQGQQAPALKRRPQPHMPAPHKDTTTLPGVDPEVARKQRG